MLSTAMFTADPIIAILSKVFKVENEVFKERYEVEYSWRNTHGEIFSEIFTVKTWNNYSEKWNIYGKISPAKYSVKDSHWNICGERAAACCCASSRVAIWKMGRVLGFMQIAPGLFIVFFQLSSLCPACSLNLLVYCLIYCLVLITQLVLVTQRSYKFSDTILPRKLVEHRVV